MCGPAGTFRRCKSYPEQRFGPEEKFVGETDREIEAFASSGVCRHDAGQCSSARHGAAGGAAGCRSDASCRSNAHHRPGACCGPDTRGTRSGERHCSSSASTGTERHHGHARASAGPGTEADRAALPSADRHGLHSPQDVPAQSAARLHGDGLPRAAPHQHTSAGRPPARWEDLPELVRRGDPGARK